VHAPSKVAFVVAEDTVAGLVRDQDIYRVSHRIQQAGFTQAQVEHALELYKLLIEVLRGAKPKDELEAASASVSKEDWYPWLGIPDKDSYLWTWYPKVGNLDTLVYWKQVRAPVLLVYGERDQLVRPTPCRGLETILGQAFREPRTLSHSPATHRLSQVFSREKTGLRTGCGVRSQVIDVLKDR
jgi:pimeloyl-ACP methyl ester carboxylesterase